ncbi:hypothetical protein DMC25_06435 [Caulobacter sp. D4A]|nr:hypothetical protein DMC25_06435 [Caulobacter sp. D4A]PXA96792.1 hypothetical protein DMC18_00585 [Caulobacter sp. D5]
MRRRPPPPRSPNLFPKTVEQFLADLDRRFPEPRPSPTDDPRQVTWDLAQRAVYLTMQDAYETSRRREDAPDVFD